MHCNREFKTWIYLVVKSFCHPEEFDESESTMSCIVHAYLTSYKIRNHLWTPIEGYGPGNSIINRKKEKKTDMFGNSAVWILCALLGYNALHVWNLLTGSGNKIWRD